VIDPTDAIPDAPVPESGAGEWFRLAEETADEYGVAVETEHPVGTPRETSSSSPTSATPTTS